MKKPTILNISNPLTHHLPPPPPERLLGNFFEELYDRLRNNTPIENEKVIPKK